MRLMGVEFVNYACFDRQYVPLGEGINLLVGRNNAGKTAILMGLAALATLPIVGWPPTSQAHRAYINSLAGYTRGNDPDPLFEVEVLVEADGENDPNPVRGMDAPSWRTFIVGRRAHLSFGFWVFPRRSEDQVLFNRAQLKIEGQPPAEVLRSSPNGVTSFTYELSDGKLANVAAVPPNVGTSGKLVIAANRQHLVPFPALDHFKPLSPLQNATLVAAHRTVAPWVGIQTATALPQNAENLSVYLQTLFGKNRRAFETMESFVLSVFPEFTAVNPTGEENKVTITLSRKGAERDIPLTHCGTGVEQVLAIATFVVTAPRGAVLLIDEPHSFLHPHAERALISFLKKDTEHRFVVSTHSSVFMNSVAPGQLVHVEPPGHPFGEFAPSEDVGRILFDLGYRSSDVLFFDGLIIVEGKSDSAVLPILLVATNSVDPAAVDRTGFLTLDGVSEDVDTTQTAIIRLEKWVGAVGRQNQPRTYLFDGDREQHQERLAAMRSPTTGEPISLAFLPRCEIENYLLVPDAISEALREEAKLTNVDMDDSSPAAVKAKLDELIGGDDANLFPRGRGDDPWTNVKGSRLLERLYSHFGNLVYVKERSGSLIAKHITSSSQPYLAEIANLLKPFYDKTTR